MTAGSVEMTVRSGVAPSATPDHHAFHAAAKEIVLASLKDGGTHRNAPLGHSNMTKDDAL
jgi:hypothetical protein